MRFNLHFFLLFLLVTLVGNAQNQNGTAKYFFSSGDNSKSLKKVDSLINSDGLTNEKEEVLSIVKDLFNDDGSNIKFILNFNKKESHFEVEKGLSVGEKGEMQSVFLKSLSKAKSKFYYNRSAKEIIEQKDFLGETYLLDSKSDSLKWKLVNEKRTINGYTCYKAEAYKKRYNLSGSTSLDKVVVWYAPEIAIPYGPYGYCGLPGLVVDVYEKQRRITLAQLEFTKEETKIKPLTKGIKTTEEDLMKNAMSKYRKQ